MIDGEATFTPSRQISARNHSKVHAQVVGRSRRDLLIGGRAKITYAHMPRSLANTFTSALTSIGDRAELVYEAVFDFV
jgi:hypothetical protein